MEANFSRMRDRVALIRACIDSLHEVDIPNMETLGAFQKLYKDINNVTERIEDYRPRKDDFIPAIENIFARRTDALIISIQEECATLNALSSSYQVHTAPILHSLPKPN